MPDNEAIMNLLKDIGNLHKTLSEKYEELSLYFYPSDKESREDDIDPDTKMVIDEDNEDEWDDED